MKNTTIAYLGAIGLLIAGCAKEHNTPSQTPFPSEEKVITDKAQQEYINETIDRLPSFAIYSENIDKYILLDLSNTKNGFDFSSPGGSVSFSSPGGTVEFVEGPDGGYYQVVTPGSSGGAGGVVTAGNVALSVSAVVCFNSGDDAFGVGLFEAGDGFSGFSGAVGIGGDFSALMDMSEAELEDTDPFDFLTGFVAYYAFDGTADGSYDIIDFLDAENETEDFLEGNAIAFLFSFQDEGGIFFSSDGEVTFSGNSVGFEGTYLGVTGLIIGFDEGPGSEDEEPEYVEVEGFGTLNCQ
jgi:hypothetical protein